MTSCLVLLPAAADIPSDVPGAEVHRYRSGLDIPGILRGCPLPAVICADAIDPAHEGAVAEAIRHHPPPVVAVRSAPWDGETPDPIAAAARGVVAGFGLRGVFRAAELFSQPPA
ncbi:hypothetical protein [Tepidiforma sp.]|uniref:hypothetical protein n=1 Tax=Tepidiforma sp. TaxID=2682230 RepID=UPI002ADDC1CB|nr:hypothetical protein [Tepidiforma sp.]